jgi:inosose dehydratase
MHLNRRQFLQSGLAASVLAAAGTKPLIAAAPAKGKSRPIGFSLYGMKPLPVSEALDHCKRIGYDNVELCLMPEFPTELKKFTPPMRREVRDKLKSTGLEPSSLLVHISLTDADQTKSLDIIKGSAEVARDLDDKRPPLIESVTGGKTDEWDKLKDKVAENMRKWAETAAASGSKIAVKNHYGQIITSPDRLLWLHKTVNHPNFTLTYDYSHYQAEGFELEPTLRAIAPHCGFIHMKDIEVGSKPLKYLLAGQSGKIDYVKYFRLLREVKYTGPILVEVSAQIHRLPGYEPVPTAERCYAFLSKALKDSTA